MVKKPIEKSVPATEPKILKSALKSVSSFSDTESKLKTMKNSSPSETSSSSSNNYKHLNRKEKTEYEIERIRRKYQHRLVDYEF